MKVINIFLIILVSMTLLSNTGSAATITTPVLFEIYTNTTYITIYNQTADSFTVSTAQHYLDIYLNGTHLIFTTTTNKTLTGISYSNGILNLTVNGTGTLTTTISTNTKLTPYNLYIDGVFSSTITTDINGNLQFNYNGDNTSHVVLITQSLLTPQQQIQISKAVSCGGITSYESTVMGIFGLALMIFGFVFVLYSLKMQNYIAITSGILTVIIGFAMLLLGNYILNSIFGALC